MDQYNERNVLKVVKELTDNSVDDELCQYFIISPKLLWNLDYPRKANVILIYNIFPIAPWRLNDTAKEIAREITNALAQEED